MTAQDLSVICDAAIDAGCYVYLSHRGVWRDVYPFSIRDGRLWVWCSLHPDVEVEGMYLTNIGDANVSEREIGYTFPYDTVFGS